MAERHGEAQRQALRLIEAYAADPDPSARVLLVTIFGDAIVGRAEDIWLGSLAELLEPLGISDRLVRTSLQRLVRDKLLLNRQQGRRSFYGVHPEARDTFWRADQRIYSSRSPEWTGAWTMAVLDGDADAEQRSAIRRELGWMGFGALTPNVLVSASVSPEAAAAAMGSAGHLDKLLITVSEVAAQSGLDDAELARRVVPVEQLGDAYAALVERYSPLADALDCGGADSTDSTAGIDPAGAFLARTLLISDYRRILLSFPAIPDALLPEDWIGNRAGRLVGGLYRALLEASEQHLARVAVTSGGAFTAEAAAHRDRFA